MCIPVSIGPILAEPVAKTGATEDACCWLTWWHCLGIKDLQSGVMTVLSCCVRVHVRVAILC